jgi:ATP-dependent helicase YprA (DUF1998 family)
MKPRTKAVERDLCAAIDHLLLHRSWKLHSCRCGYKIVVGHIESGECPECTEAPMFEEGDEDMKTRILVSILAETIRQLLDRHGCLCLECSRARANLLLVEEQYGRRKAS